MKRVRGAYIYLILSFLALTACKITAGPSQGDPSSFVKPIELPPAPKVMSISINGGASIINQPRVNIMVSTDKPANMIQNVRFAETFGDCQSEFADNNWLPYVNSTTSISYVSASSNGPKRICAWVKDIHNQVSTVANSGTEYVDSYSYSLDLGSAPSFTMLKVSNATTGANFGTNNFVTGDVVKIEWTAYDGESLSSAPVDIFYSTDDVTLLPVAVGASAGVASGNPQSWSSSYTNFLAPSDGFFKIVVYARDASGQISSISSGPLNAGKWSLYAGNNSKGNNESATAATLGASDQNTTSQNVVASSKGDIYVSDPYMIRKIEYKTGIIKKYILLGSNERLGFAEAGADDSVLPMAYGPLSGQAANMVIDNNDNIYFIGTPLDASSNHLNPKIYKLNTNTGELSHYAAGGTSVANDVDAMEARLYTQTRFTINRKNGDIYYGAPCVYPIMPIPNYVEGIQIRKITQKPNGEADKQYAVAGNCTKGTYIDGDNALEAAIENANYMSIHGLYYHEDTDALYFWVLNSSPYITKLINGKLYKISDASMSSAAFDRINNRIIIAGDYGSSTKRNHIGAIIPTSLEQADTVENLITAQPNAALDNCNEDSQLFRDACAQPNSVFQLPDGSVGFIDGPRRNALNTARIRHLSSDGRVRTLAGLKSLSFANMDKLAIRFGFLREIHFKSNNSQNQNVFPSGLYYGDGRALAIGRIDTTTGSSSIIAGSQISKDPQAGRLFNNSSAIGEAYNESTVGYFNFDLEGLIVYASSAYAIKRVDSSRQIRNVLGENYGSPFSTVANGTTASNVHTQNYGGLLTLVSDNNNNVYFGPKYYTTIGSDFKPIIGRVNKIDGKFYRVLGGSANAVSPDCTTPGCAVTSTLKCDFGWSTPWTEGHSCLLNDDYDSVNQRLYIAEGNAIRFVHKPHLPNESTFGTLVNVGRPIWRFVWRPNSTKIYYTSKGELYCIDTASSTTPGCNNNVLTRTGGIPQFSADALAIDSSGNVYVTNINLQNQIYVYRP